jgi:hypothetical protein
MGHLMSSRKNQAQEQIARAEEFLALAERLIGES